VIDPLYADVIVRRYGSAPGNPAVLVETGEAFTELSAPSAMEQAPA
jgi:hypothetical protein